MLRPSQSLDEQKFQWTSHMALMDSSMRWAKIENHQLKSSHKSKTIQKTILHIFWKGNFTLFDYFHLCIRQNKYICEICATLTCKYLYSIMSQPCHLSKCCTRLKGLYYLFIVFILCVLVKTFFLLIFWIWVTDIKYVWEADMSGFWHYIFNISSILLLCMHF